uniref:Peptidase S8/S53 domain-containing protein n=1 Tax=Panagrolaimus davidi TaxID=227884 RepID=A0A914QJ58_9BILA
MLYLKSKAYVYNLFSAKPYIPKYATQQSVFLSKYPEFDGRGTKIAIIDSGIDVSLEGLQKTSEGHTKIIDCFDFTGVGDVDTSTIKEMDSKNFLIGLNGKKFKIPKNWKNPSRKWHLGFKDFYKQTVSKSSEKLPKIDCIVWFNGEKWCACIETYKKDLEKAKILTNFCDEHVYGILDFKGNEIVYCISVKNDGNLLKIFTRYLDDGSNIALIAAAHFPDNPKQDGLAPGAQIISMNVLDPGIKNSVLLDHVHKALEKCIEMKVDIIIYSLSSFCGNEGIEKLILEMFNKHNILILKSVSNEGPFYGSVQTNDQNIESSIFTIGAVLTSEAQKIAYHIRTNKANPHPPVIYNFSSRGPGANENRGLDFVAPATMIRKISKISFYNSFHGTNFASSNAAGAIACLISALKSKSIQYSPDSIKFALFKTAFLPKNENIFEFGHGIIQINKAFDYFCENMINFKNIPKWMPKAGGMYFGDRNKIIMEHDFKISDFINIETKDTTKWKLQVSKNAEKFMTISEIDENNKSFTVKVDTNKLEAGNFNSGEIMILHPTIGSIYNIPVNIVHPIVIKESQNCHIKKEAILTFEKPYRIRFFLESAKICDIKISAPKSIITDLWIKYGFPNSMTLDDANNTKQRLIFNQKNPNKTISVKIKEMELFDIYFYQKIRGVFSCATFKFEFNFKNDLQNEKADEKTILIQ